MAAKDGWLSTINLKHNLSRQIKVGRDVKLQNMQIILPKFLRVMMQSWAADQSQMTGDKTQHLFPTVTFELTFCQEQTIDCVRHSHKQRYQFFRKLVSSIDWSNQSLWMINAQTFLSLQLFHFFPVNGRLSSFKQEQWNFFRFLRQCIVNVLKGKLQSTKRNFSAKIQEQDLFVISNTNTLEADKRNSGIRKGTQHIKISSLPGKNHLSLEGAFCCRHCFQQRKFDYESITKQKLPNYPVQQNPEYRTDPFKNERNKVES